MRFRLPVTALAVVMLAGCTRTPAPIPARVPDQAVTESGNALSNRQLASQLVLAGTGFTDVTQIADQLREYPVGGFLVTDRDTPTADALTTLVEDLDALYAALQLPSPLTLVDQEGGVVQRVGFAGPTAAQFDLTSTDEAGELGRERGAALAQLGIDVVLAPVLDVSQPGSAIAERAFVGDADAVARLGTALISGLQEDNIAACPKHFPGLGSIVEDTHEESATLAITFAAWEASDARPFLEAAPDVRCLLIAHVATPWWGSQPASLNEQAVRYVRSIMDFEGALISDDLAMGALDSHGSLGERAVTSLNAGMDGLIMTGSLSEITEAIDAIQTALENGRLDRGRLEDSVNRLYALSHE
jgi:beta-N-acetylhexosaminidase